MATVLLVTSLLAGPPLRSHCWKEIRRLVFFCGCLLLTSTSSKHATSQDPPYWFLRNINKRLETPRCRLFAKTASSMDPLLFILTIIGLLFASTACRAAPSVSLVSNTQLDPNGIFFVSYDGVVNVNSFQLSGVLTYGSYQYAAWYTSSKAAVLARRQLPSGAWSTLQLPHTLSTSDSHNVIALGVSPSDGKIHVALDCHSTPLYYTSSEAGLATSGASWVASRFGAITNTLGTLNIGRCGISIHPCIQTDSEFILSRLHSIYTSLYY